MHLLPQECLIEFFNYVKSHILLPTTPNMNKSFMQKMTWDLLQTRFEHRIIDTSFLIRLSNPTMKSLPLEEVCKQCGIEVTIGTMP